jgi:hypothetical protein
VDAYSRIWGDSAADKEKTKRIPHVYLGRFFLEHVHFISVHHRLWTLPQYRTLYKNPCGDNFLSLVPSPLYFLVLNKCLLVLPQVSREVAVVAEDLRPGVLLLYVVFLNCPLRDLRTLLVLTSLPLV